MQYSGTTHTIRINLQTEVKTYIDALIAYSFGSFRSQLMVVDRTYLPDDKSMHREL